MKIIFTGGGYYLAIPNTKTRLAQHLLDWWNEEGEFEDGQSCEQETWCRENTKWHKFGWYLEDGKRPTLGERDACLSVKFRSVDDAAAFKLKFA